LQSEAAPLQNQFFPAEFMRAKQLAMDISIRESHPDDAQAIFDLRSDPRLFEMQYRPLSIESPLSLFAATKPGPAIPDNGMMSSTILVGGLFAGHILRIYRTKRKEQYVTLGWNIIPTLWGRGVAPAAVGLLLKNLFEQNEEIQVLAFCFATNSRSIRVIEKLGFEPAKPNWVERLRNFVRTRGKHKLLKFRLGYKGWNASKKQHHNVGP